jgi:hypothetical protein
VKRVAWAALLLLVAGCTRLHAVDGFEDDFARVQGKRRIVALVSPS